jgi:carboxypeptidase C (cathepsin A)
LYNGGPGAASLWLHMGAFGPRVIALPSAPTDDGAPPHPVQGNPHTILDVSDLVFVDPVGTGFSRPLGKKTHEDFYGIAPDAQSIAGFIQAWIEQNGRWSSPKYLAGESYGTTRTGAVTKQLLDAHVGLSGVVLISGVLDYQNNRFSHGNIMSYVSFLPTYAATAWYHNMLPDRPDDLETYLDEVRQYARTDYATALISGSRLSPATRRDVIAQLHAYTGLSKDYLDRTNLRILPFRFMKELRRKDGLVLGRADSRYVGVEADAAGEYPETDTAVDAIGEAFVAAMHDHNRTFLGVRMDEPYRAFNSDASRQWSWLSGAKPPSGGRFATVVPYLGQALRRNAEFRILMASGYYDLATPFFAAENALSEMGLVPKRIEYVQYRSGHMLYLQDDIREQFLSDVRRFIQHPGVPRAEVSR